MFGSVLVANRGEISVRVQKTLRLLGIRAVAIFTDVDAGALHVARADLALRVGSYLSIDDVLDAAIRAGADAVHPGYGFLAENADFARAVAAAGIGWIGPSPEAIAAMGDKISARRIVAAAGVPVVPGLSEPGLTDAQLIAGAPEVGFPVLVKPSAGGGGKGMHVVTDPAGLPEALATARREAAASFGDDTLFLERYVTTPRHLEVQVMADAHGHVVHLGERECSLQRRHQKVVEEAPSPLLTPAQREAYGALAVEVARSVDYVGAGTVELIVSGDDADHPYFLEMNTRLQVEHPVTELVTGLDLVELQLRVAAGEPLPFGQDQVVLTGHAVEARVYAEDPAAGFLPTGGTVSVYREPAGVRVDTSLSAGATVGAAYDPMLAKVIAYGADRTVALARLDAALGETVVLGLTTNLGFLRALVSLPEVVAGDLDTGLIERTDLTGSAVPQAVHALWGALRWAATGGDDLWSRPSGWRVGSVAETVWTTTDGVEVGVTPGAVRVGSECRPYVLRGDVFQLGAEAHRFVAAGDWVWLGGAVHHVAERVPDRSAAAAGAGDAVVRSPMPGAVVAVRAAAGDVVEAGAPLVVVEAMKMEHTLTAPYAGTVAAVAARVGDQVAVGQELARMEEPPVGGAS